MFAGALQHWVPGLHQCPSPQSFDFLWDAATAGTAFGALVAALISAASCPKGTGAAGRTIVALGWLAGASSATGRGDASERTIGAAALRSASSWYGYRSE